MKRLFLLSFLLLNVTPALVADFGDVLFPAAVGAGVGGIFGGGRGAGIGAGVGLGVGLLNEARSDRYYREYRDDYRGSSYNSPKYREATYYRQPVYQQPYYNHDNENQEYLNFNPRSLD